MSDIKVAIIMGSDSDFPVMEETKKTLDKFGVECDVRVMSAHRTPGKVVEYVGKEAPSKGVQVFIAGAGGAAHLAGVVAAHTTKPVIGVPLDATSLNGMDALLATVQMPPGIPVATVAVGKFGAMNAALLAIQILALSDNGLSKKLVDYKKDMENKVAEKDKSIQGKLSK